jgi:hypothetical protein
MSYVGPRSGILASGHKIGIAAQSKSQELVSCGQGSGQVKTSGIGRPSRQGRVWDALYAQLCAHLTEREVVDLTVGIATINCWNRIAVSFGKQPAVQALMLRTGIGR